MSERKKLRSIFKNRRKCSGSRGVSENKFRLKAKEQEEKRRKGENEKREMIFRVSVVETAKGLLRRTRVRASADWIVVVVNCQLCDPVGLVAHILEQCRII